MDNISPSTMKQKVEKHLGKLLRNNMPTKSKKYIIKKSGSFAGKSNKLGHGGRAAQLKAQGASPALIGYLARKAGAAPGMRNYHSSKK